MRAPPLILRSLAVPALALVGLGRLVATRRRRERRRRLAERDVARSAVLRFVAHEARAPLSLARGYVDMVRSQTLGPVSEPAREALGLVDERLQEIDELAGLLVEAARVQDGRSQLRLELLDLRDVLGEAAHRTRALAGARHRLVLDQPRGPVAVVADRMRVRAVVTNLIGNAIKYSPDGGEVRCTLRQGAGVARLSVTDHGIGIDRAGMAELFQPFNRLHRESTRDIKGLGLGLFMARETARAHRGDLSARRNPDGHGTTFELRLPAATVRQSAPGPGAPVGRALARPAHA